MKTETNKRNRKHTGIKPETLKRNLKIRKEHEKLTNSGFKECEAKKILSERYFLGIETINWIVFSEKALKRVVDA